MKIAIIGGGWLGCHVALKLKKHHEITIFEKSEIFSGSSFYNQNRLHKGFHYSRNQKTRQLCKDTFDLFLQDYGFLTEDINNNYYLIPTTNSLIDFGTFESIFTHENIPFSKSKLNGFKNIENSVIVGEKFINPIKAKEYFKNQLQNHITLTNIQKEDLPHLSKNFDYIINVTNNSIQTIDDCYFELCLTLIYDKITDVDFGSITMIDGPLFSIYPYHDKQYTVTDVEYTPLFTFNTLKHAEEYKNKIDKEFIDNIKLKFETKILSYYDKFTEHFKYNHFFTSIKVKHPSASADRFPIIKKDNNIISCFTGKIQGMYILEKYIENEFNNR
jgi:hypothetical protein